MEGTVVEGEQYIKDENGVLLRGKGESHDRWARFFHTLLNTKSSKLDHNLKDQFPKRPVALSLGDPPAMIEMTAAIKSKANEKAVGPDSLPAELLKLDDPVVLGHFHSILLPVWRKGDVPQ